MEQDIDDDITSPEALNESITINMLTGRSSRVYYNISFITTRIIRFYA